MYGIVSKRYCCDKVYKDGLCKHHYDAKVRKSTKWEDRPGYRTITKEELNKGCSFKEKQDTVNNIYRKRNGVIQKYSSKTNSWNDTKKSFNNELYVIKRS